MIKILGLACRARKIIVGTEFVVDGIRKNKVELVLLASDSSELTKKKIYDKSRTYQKEVLEIFTTQEMSDAIGKKNVKVIGIVDKGFKELIINKKEGK